MTKKYKKLFSDAAAGVPVSFQVKVAKAWEPSCVARRHAMSSSLGRAEAERGEGGVCKHYDVPGRTASAAAPAPKNRSPEESEGAIGGVCAAVLP